MKQLSLLTPKHTLDELYPPGSVYAPRGDFGKIGWVHKDRFRLDSATAYSLSIMGDMPVICHRDGVIPEFLAWLHQAGVHVTKRYAPYEGEAEYIDVACSYVAEGGRLVMLYPLPDSLNDNPKLLFPYSLYDYLNNKANIPELVPAHHLPRHSFFTLGELELTVNFMPESEVYLKACVDGASGSGTGVWFCPDKDARMAALAQMVDGAGLMGVRVEEALDIDVCWCVNISVLDTSVYYVGAAMQLFDAPARQTGNRIDPDCMPSNDVINLALAIGERAREKGFLGVAGLDIGVDQQGRVYAFDLNFRLVACTPQILFHEAACERADTRLSQSWSVLVDAPLMAAAERLEPLVESRRLIPLRGFAGNALSQGVSVLSGILLADDTEGLAQMTGKLEHALSDILVK